ncbi:MAG TPA: 50S ribosomal protein L15 [Armatimonadota bacterium]|jgi:large subunit ribosomal protein L15
MKLTDLRPNKSRTQSPKRVGRGHAAGQGKTSGRGQKGQRSRGPIKRGFEGGQTPLYRRLPSLRGQSNKASNIGLFRHEFSVVNVENLNRFEAGTVVDQEVLEASRLVKQVKHGVKILGRGTLDRALTVKANAFSATAREAIEQAGGTAEVIGR